MKRKWVLYRGQYLTRVQFARIVWKRQQQKGES